MLIMYTLYIFLYLYVYVTRTSEMKKRKVGLLKAELFWGILGKIKVFVLLSSKKTNPPNPN